MFFFPRNTKLTSSLPRPGPTAVSDTTARWKNWLWTAIWSDLFGCQIPSSGTPRPPIPTGLQCLTSCSEYGTMGRYFTLWGKPQQPWKSLKLRHSFTVLILITCEALMVKFWNAPRKCTTSCSIRSCLGSTSLSRTQQQADVMSRTLHMYG